jgi:hypothetical protein
MVKRKDLGGGWFVRSRNLSLPANGLSQNKTDEAVPRSVKATSGLATALGRRAKLDLAPFRAGKISTLRKSPGVGPDLPAMGQRQVEEIKSLTRSILHIYSLSDRETQMEIGELTLTSSRLRINWQT